jgi:uncharacterized protein Yka (UPF0111/DUF47 family)
MSGKKFYRLFDEVAMNLKDITAAFLHAMHEQDHRQLENYVSQLEKLEHANDILTHKIFVELGRNFITPFDREDIHALASTLDDIADLTHGITRQMRNYDIREAGRITRLIAEQQGRFIEMLCASIGELKNKRSMTILANHCESMRAIVTQADNMVDAAIAEVFTDHNEAYAVMKKMDHYELLQALLNKDADAVNAIESVIVKYA